MSYEGCDCPLFDSTRHLCPRYGFHVNKTERELCEKRPEYREAFASPEAPQHAREKRLIHKVKDAVAQPSLYPTLEIVGECVHRGASLGTRKCDMCGADRGKPFEVFECAVHGECTYGRRIKKVHPCIGCNERVAP
jgi:hypothetical protein